ncbi:MAG: hypothetical protein BHV59_01905 [Bifidobacterium sp. 56_9_plus]|nr:MAG: hypothetical protein BHV59_01905 [Bifidobacterium sp. 56_9_plus]
MWGCHWTGTGKSTILNLLIGFLPPTDGKILIDRINMVNLDMNEYRKQIAVVPQNTILFSGTIRENITYGLENISDDEIWSVIHEVGLEDLLDKMPDGLDTPLGEHGDRLSGGQKQRISIAQPSGRLRDERRVQPAVRGGGRRKRLSL